MAVAQTAVVSYSKASTQPGAAIHSKASLTVVHTGLIGPAISLESLYEQHFNGLVRFIRGRIQSHEDAEDMAQQAFIRIQPLLETNQLDNPAAYLYQTASNLVIDQLRHRKIQRSYISSELDKQAAMYEEYHMDMCTPERKLTADNDLAAVEAALEGLPHKCRQAFLMHRVKGYTYNDIADAKNVSVSSVEKYILQALKHCRNALES